MKLCYNIMENIQENITYLFLYIIRKILKKTIWIIKRYTIKINNKNRIGYILFIR